MGSTLSVSFRPQSLKDLVGLSKLANLIIGHVKSSRIPRAWLFAGDTGVGKTTVARILALSLQCSHQEEFGNPCGECIRNQSHFDIVEINASEVSGVDDIGVFAKTSIYSPRPPSRYRVFILDECQRMSSAAQNLLLKPFEDAKRSVWIVCTTDPQKILPTLRSRCVYYKIPSLNSDGVKDLVFRAVTSTNKIPSKIEVELVGQLLERGVSSARLVLMAVEKLLAGASPAAAAQIELVESSIDTLGICRMTIKGDWKNLSVALKGASPEDARNIVVSVMGYLRSVVLNPTPSRSSIVAAEGIRELGNLLYVDDGARSAMLAAVLYHVTMKFGQQR